MDPDLCCTPSDYDKRRDAMSFVCQLVGTSASSGATVDGVLSAARAIYNFLNGDTDVSVK